MFLKKFLFLCAWCGEFGNIWTMENSKPNIVIIMADDMGFDDVSFRGSKEFLTPNIDALAYHGKIINRFYTPAMCTPSRAALLTGLYPIHTGTQHLVILNEEPWGILENFTNMAEILKSEGYSTHLIGKWHLGMARKQYTPIYNGFDTHVGYWGGFIDYFNRRCKMPSNFSKGYDFRCNLDVMCAPPGTYVTDLLTQEAERVIMRNNAENPLFLMVNHLATHAGNDEDPLQAPEEEIKKFEYIPDVRRRIYAAMASKLDESVGRIVKALDKTNQLTNSIIIFYSDNGAPSLGFLSNSGSNWPLRGQKNSPWEGGLRVPAAIWSPLIKNKASIYQPPMYAADWLPTLMAAAKISLSNWELKLDGLNHWPDLVASEIDFFLNEQREREILHVLDDIIQVKSFMMGQFKYINGTTINGSYDHVILTKSPNVLDPRDLNYAEVIQNSLVSKTLAKHEEKPLTSFDIENLRTQAEIKCDGEVDSPCNPLKEECLFNIWLDPCEKNNLAKDPQYSEILNKIKIRLEELRLTSIAPRTGGSLIDNDPSRHDCTWTNFLEEPATNYILDCTNNSPPC